MLNTCIKKTGICGGITFLSTAVSTGFGAASGAIGTAILSAAGYAYPSVKAAAAMGATGSAIIGAFTGCCLGAYTVATDRNFSDSAESNILATVSTQTLAGILGNVVLGGITTLGKDAALSAVGSAVLSGGIGVTALCAFGFFCYRLHRSMDRANAVYQEIQSPPTERMDVGGIRTTSGYVDQEIQSPVTEHKEPAKPSPTLTV